MSYEALTHGTFSYGVYLCDIEKSEANVYDMVDN